MLQVIHLIENDFGVLSTTNESIPTHDFTEVLKGFRNFWMLADGNFSKDHKATWNVMFVAEFLEILTRWGICHSFNFVNSTKLFNYGEVSDDFHFNDVLQIYSISRRLQIPQADIMYEENPMRTRSSELGFEGIFREIDYETPNEMFTTYKSDLFKNPFHVYDGYHLIFHNPRELPDLNSVHHYTIAYHSLIFWIKPQMAKIEDSLKELPPVERNCYLDDEKKLKFFVIYSQNNCDQECLANFTLKSCGCVQFFMMRELSYWLSGMTNLI